MRGYEALRETAAWFDLQNRGRIRASGADRARLLHAMSSNHVEQLKAGEGCYAFFLNAQGRILADAVILAQPDALLLSTEPEARESLYEHLDRYIIADDVTLEDETAGTAEIAIEGPESAAVLAKLGAPEPEAAYAHRPWKNGLVVRKTNTGQPGFSLIVPAAERKALVTAIEASGTAAADPEAVRTVRIELGHPRYGEDLTDRYVPQETQVLWAVHFNKGCYLGQEIVERIRSRGGVHRFLVPLEIEGAEAPAAGTRLMLAEKEIGEITSAAYSPARGKVVALGYVRLQDPGTAEMSAAGRPARVTAPRPRE